MNFGKDKFSAKKFDLWIDIWHDNPNKKATLAENGVLINGVNTV